MEDIIQEMKSVKEEGEDGRNPKKMKREGLKYRKEVN